MRRNPRSSPAEPKIHPDRTRRRLLLGWIAGAALLALPSPPSAAERTLPAPGERLVRQLVSEFDLDAGYVREALRRARFDNSVIERMEKPYEARPYAEYRPLFVTPRLAEKGREYLATHRAHFDAAEERYGVQPELIAAILGMESRYGDYPMRDRVLDALYTLASGYPRRADFFRRELGHFLTLCREEELDPADIRGSYAGAFGTTQFIPSSFRGYAVDADGDGRRDVWDSPADIIHSVAHYFSRHRWDAARPVAHWLQELPSNPLTKEALREETRSWYRLDRLSRAGLPDLPGTWHGDDRVTLIRLQTDNGERPLLVHYNFHVITRWNRSYNYAMAATELAYLMGCELCDVGSAG